MYKNNQLLILQKGKQKKNKRNFGKGDITKQQSGQH